MPHNNCAIFDFPFLMSTATATPVAPDGIAEAATVNVVNKTPLGIITEKLKDIDMAIEELDLTSKQLEAFADFYSSVHGVRALLAEQDTVSAHMPAGFIATLYTECTAPDGKVVACEQTTMTMQMLLSACEGNTHPGSLELRERLLGAVSDDPDAKFAILVQYFCSKGIEDLRDWHIEGTVDLLLLRSALSATSKTMLSQFKPSDMLKIIFQ
jgi:hypothetical protein